MISDPKKIQEIIEEEIHRFINGLEDSKTKPVDLSGERILLFVLSSPVAGDAFPGLNSLTERYTCARLNAWYGPLENEAGQGARGLLSLPEFPPPATAIVPSEALKQIRAVFLVYPSLALMARTALGLGDDFGALLILQALSSATPVLAIRSKLLPSDSIAPLPNSPQALIRQYEKTLGDWGVRWINEERIFPLMEQLMEDPLTGLEKKELRRNNPKRIIVTGEDVEERIRRGERQWVLPADAIITSVAQETAEKKGFILKLKKESLHDKDEK